MTDKATIARKDADQFLLRLPDGLRARIEERANESGRSLNTEIIAAIEHHLTRANLFDELVARVDKLEQRVNQPVGGQRR